MAGLLKQKTGLFWINPADILPALHQPRTEFNDAGLKELSESIATHGILQPLLIVREADHYRLIAGERRLRAAKLAGLSRVPCLITSRSAEEAAKIALIENLQREDLTFFEEAAAYRRLAGDFGLSQADIAHAVNKDPSTIANKIRLLRLPISAQDLIRKHGLTERHARAFLKVENENLLMDLLESAIEHKWNVAETEAMIASALKPKPARQRNTRICSIKDIRLCINSLDRAVAALKQAGIKPQTQIHEEERFVEYTIRIPKTS